MLMFSVGPTDLFCHVLNVSCHFVHGEDGGVTGGGDACEPPEQVGQFGGHRARLVAVELGQRLRLEVLEHEEGVAPQQLHLQSHTASRVRPAY